MRIGIDISQLAFTGTGVARFTTGLVRTILEHGRDHDWIFLYSSLRIPFPHELARDIHRTKNTLVHMYIPPTVHSFIWNTLHILPPELLLKKLDWFISSDWTEPPSSIRKATIIHDLTVLQHPNTVHPRILYTQKKRLEHVQKESSLIITDSIATKQDVLRFFPHTNQRVHTLYPGVSVVKPSASAIDMCKSKFKIDKPFILAVGKLEPRKNIPRLITAFNRVNDGSHELIIVGPDGWENTLSGKPQQNIRFLGLVSEVELHALYKLCAFFAYPSLWEGFGYPVVEAMLHHKAVLTSNTSSLNEVGAKGALLCNPLSTEDIAQGLHTLMSDNELRNKLATDGFQHAQQFSWKKYYEGLLARITHI